MLFDVESSEKVSSMSGSLTRRMSLLLRAGHRILGLETDDEPTALAEVRALADDLQQPSGNGPVLKDLCAHDLRHVPDRLQRRYQPIPQPRHWDMFIRHKSLFYMSLKTLVHTRMIRS